MTESAHTKPEVQEFIITPLLCRKEDRIPISELSKKAINEVNHMPTNKVFELYNNLYSALIYS